MNESGTQAGDLFPSFGVLVSVLSIVRGAEEGAEFKAGVAALYDESHGYEVNPELRTYCTEFELTPAQLASVKKLYLGDESGPLLGQLMPYWDGESSEFSVEDTNGLNHLPQLRLVSLGLLCKPNIDLAPLLELPGLEEVSCGEVAPNEDQLAVLRALKANGVELSGYALPDLD